MNSLEESCADKIKALEESCADQKKAQEESADKLESKQLQVQQLDARVAELVEQIDICKRQSKEKI